MDPFETKCLNDVNIKNVAIFYFEYDMYDNYIAFMLCLWKTFPIGSELQNIAKHGLQLIPITPS